MNELFPTSEITSPTRLERFSKENGIEIFHDEEEVTALRGQHSVKHKDEGEAVRLLCVELGIAAPGDLFGDEILKEGE